MTQKNNITIQGNGNITLQGIHNSPIHIDTSNAQDIRTKLAQLEDSLLDSLAQIAAQERERVGELFTALLADVLSQKNMVTGTISNIQGDAIIGDNNTRNYYFISHEPQNRIPKNLSAKLPKLAQDQIIGRTKDIEDLHQRLFQGKKVVVVNGMGGIGKTTLAQVYLTQYYEEYQHILWISINPESGNFEADVVNTEGLLERLQINKIEKKINNLFLEALKSLHELPAQPCLMVLDNATKALEHYQDYLPSQPNWHLLATSREKIEYFDLKELDFLNEEEAIQLFEFHYKRNQLDRAFLKELVQDLEYHTLTIEILAKTAQNQRSTPQELLTAIQKDLATNVTTRHSQQEKIDKLTSYLCSIFRMTDLDEAEKYLLQQLICLPAEWQTFELLEDLLVYEEQSRGQLSDTLSSLVKKGWLLENEALDSYKIHKITVDVVRQTIPPSEVNVGHLIRKMTNKLEIDQTKDNPVDKFQWVPYGEVLLEQIEYFDSKEIALLQNNLGLILQDLGDYVGARKLLEKAMKSAEANFGMDHPTTAVSYSNLGSILQDLGDYVGAKELIEKAFLILEKQLGLDHPNTQIIKGNLDYIQSLMP